MPMLDAYIPEGALAPEAESQLLSDLTDILLRHEGADPSHPVSRSLAWVFLHRPEAVYAAGELAQEPRYRFVASVPEGQFDDERRAAIVDAITTAVLDAEQGTFSREPMRVWVFAHEIPDGQWGAGGEIFRLEDIVTLVIGDRETASQYAQARLG